MATFHFENKELGHKISDTELDEFKRSRYADVRGRQTNLAESPAQLLLEAVAAKQSGSKKAIIGFQCGNLSRKPYKNSGNLIGEKLPTKSSDT